MHIKQVSFLQAINCILLGQLCALIFRCLLHYVSFHKFIIHFHNIYLTCIYLSVSLDSWVHHLKSIQRAPYIGDKLKTEVNEKQLLLHVHIPCFLLHKKGPKLKNKIAKHFVLCVHSWSWLPVATPQIIKVIITGLRRTMWEAMNITTCDLCSLPSSSSLLQKVIKAISSSVPNLCLFESKRFN